MDKVGILFPGQGSQYAGMGKDLYNQIPTARNIMEDANDILGFDIKSIIFDGTDKDILPTQIAQPAIYIVSAMYFEKFKQMNKEFEIVAGHSLGEYTALYSSKVISFEDGLNLVRKRGLAMSQNNNLGKMYAIMGVCLEEVTRYIEEFNQRVVIANINSKNQIVISGYTYETAEVAERLSGIEGSKIKELNVSSAFHSPLMLEAKTVMGKEISRTQFNEPVSEIIPNVLGYGIKDVNIIKNSLVEQITGQVKWLDTIMYIKKKGINQLYEVGPGEVLKKLNQTITFRPRCNLL